MANPMCIVRKFSFESCKRRKVEFIRERPTVSAALGPALTSRRALIYLRARPHLISGECARAARCRADVDCDRRP
ncbi:hypothetical protein EVAR_5898_1 [Eumeta japonica]|uniref:Uncharacterized protein n=1 Tax=Eumeta variegata TaxID=151549 RepID=A0A4C1TCY3_EUMVA|nr:hypothetical protein EVAR_5898_1 [Eumeta japonica]